MIARIENDGEPRALGFGWQRARGDQGRQHRRHRGSRETPSAPRSARPRRWRIPSCSGAIVNLSCGQPESRQQNIQWPIGGRAVTEADLRAILGEGRRRSAEDGRETVHAFPLGFTVDATPGAEDPRGMICETHRAPGCTCVDAAQASLLNLGATLLRCDLVVEELVSAPFAAGLATLVEDEKQLGATVIDMGGGTTSIAVFAEGHLMHTAQIPVGGWNVTNDLARGLSTPIAHAERLKTLHGGVLGAPDDEQEWLPVPQVGRGGGPDRPGAARHGHRHHPAAARGDLRAGAGPARGRRPQLARCGRRVVLTGGASQLVGVRELAGRVLERQVRLGRPHPVRGLPETASGPAFAAPLGLLAWGAGEGRPLAGSAARPRSPGGRFRRFVNWLRDRA